MNSKKIILYFRATLDTDFVGSGKEKPYREIVIKKNQSLSTLAQAIVTSFGFYFDHCYGFYDNFENTHKSREKYELFTDLPDVEDTKGALGVSYVKVFKAFPNIGKKLRFLFDYGDTWLFTIELLDLKLVDEKQKYPRVIKKVGKAPEQYPPLEMDEEEVDEEHWYHKDCKLCNDLKDSGIPLQWFPDVSIEKKKTVH